MFYFFANKSTRDGLEGSSSSSSGGCVVSSQDSPVPAGKSPPRARWAKKGGMWKILQGGFRESNAAAGTATEPAVMATPPAKFFSGLGRGYIHVSRAVRDLSGPYQLASGSQIPGKSPCQPVNLPLVGDRRVQFFSRKPESNLAHTLLIGPTFSGSTPRGDELFGTSRTLL